MSHRKVHSQGSIPFSWEDKPGISKFTPQNCPTNISLHALNLAPPPSAVAPLLLPPPPCSNQAPPPRRSASAKGRVWWEEDPFLVAYKECTKLSGESKRGGGSKARKTKSKSKSIFWCKNSSEVRDDCLVRISNLPSLPRYHTVQDLRWN